MQQTGVVSRLLPPSCFLDLYLLESCGVIGTQEEAAQARERPLACPHGSPQRPLPGLHGTSDSGFTAIPLSTHGSISLDDNFVFSVSDCSATQTSQGY